MSLISTGICRLINRFDESICRDTKPEPWAEPPHIFMQKLEAGTINNVRFVLRQWNNHFTHQQVMYRAKTCLFKTHNIVCNGRVNYTWAGDKCINTVHHGLYLGQSRRSIMNRIHWYSICNIYNIWESNHESIFVVSASRLVVQACELMFRSTSRRWTTKESMVIKPGHMPCTAATRSVASRGFEIITLPQQGYVVM